MQTIPHFKVKRTVLSVAACLMLHLPKSKVSSTNCKLTKELVPPFMSNPSRRSALRHMTNMWLKPLATRTNRSHERGSPCLEPLVHLISLRGVPLMKTLVYPKANQSLIEDNHCGPNHLADRLSIKRSHSTESKAFWKSNLRRNTGCFFFAKMWIIFSTVIYPSQIYLLLMKSV